MMEYDEIKRRVEHNPDIKAELAELEAEVTQRKIEHQLLRWRAGFDDRQQQLIDNCKTYTGNNPAGLPGHNLMVIIERMAAMLDAAWERGYRI